MCWFFFLFRKRFHLPHQRSLRNWTSSVQCHAGFFPDVYEELGKRAATDPKYKDCTLMFDSMHIKSRSFYNKAKGCYEGFVDFGEDLDIQINSESMATEALVFLLVGLKGKVNNHC